MEDAPRVLKYAESFGANGYRITSAGELLPTPRTALGKEVVFTSPSASHHPTRRRP